MHQGIYVGTSRHTPISDMVKCIKAFMREQVRHTPTLDLVKCIKTFKWGQVRQTPGLDLVKCIKIFEWGQVRGNATSDLVKWVNMLMLGALWLQLGFGEMRQGIYVGTNSAQQVKLKS